MSPGNRRNDALRILGLAQRAGSVERGLDAVRRALRAGRARLVLTAGDASPVQLKKLEGLMRARRTDRRTVASREALGAALGAAPLTAVVVTRQEWADRLREELPLTAERTGRTASSGGR